MNDGSGPLIHQWALALTIVAAVITFGLNRPFDGAMVYIIAAHLLLREINPEGNEVFIDEV